MYVVRDDRTQKLLFHIFFERNFSVTLPNGARFLLLVHGNSQAKAQILYELSVPTAFKVQLFSNAMALMSREVGTKKVEDCLKCGE